MSPTQQPAAKPTAKQLRYLRQLALARGVTFIYPATRAQASAQIRALKRLQPNTRSDRRREQLEVTRDMATRRGDAAQVHPAELTGHGSSATWKQFAS